MTTIKSTQRPVVHDTTLQIRISSEDLDAIRKAAQSHQVSVSDYVRQVMLDHCETTRQASA